MISWRSLGNYICICVGVCTEFFHDMFGLSFDIFVVIELISLLTFLMIILGRTD